MHSLDMRIGKTLSLVMIMLLVTLFPFCSKYNTLKTSPDNKKKYVFFPPLPAKPRYQYLTTFTTSSDIEKKKSKFFKFVAGSETRKDFVIKKAHGVDSYRGVIYVCDSRSNVVVTLDLAKRKLGFLGYKGQGRLLKPVNITIDKENNVIYVADMLRKQVLAYNIDGDLLKVYGEKREFSPSDIDIRGDELFISDIKAHQILVLDISTGEILRRIGEKGRMEGQLFHPTSIKIFENKIFIVDSTNNRVSIFDLNGNYIDSLGSIGDRPGNFVRAKGIDIDKQGRIYVIDSAFQNVQIFNKEKKLLLYMLGPGRERYNLYMPAAITIDYENLSLFSKYISPDFKAEYLLYITSNFGKNKVNVYAFGEYEEK